MAELLPYEEARKRTPPPDWWAPKIDRDLFRDLQKRNNYRAFISHGLYFLMMAAVGWVCAFLYQRGQLLVHPRRSSCTASSSGCATPACTRASTAPRSRRGS